jgi:hypothetical protein
MLVHGRKRWTVLPPRHGVLSLSLSLSRLFCF